MIIDMVRRLLGSNKNTTPPDPVGMEDLFNTTSAPEYDAAKRPSRSNVVIAPRSADADLAKLETPIPALSVAEEDTEQDLAITPPVKRPAVRAEKPRSEEAGWGALDFGD